MCIPPPICILFYYEVPKDEKVMPNTIPALVAAEGVSVTPGKDGVSVSVNGGEAKVVAPTTNAEGVIGYQVTTEVFLKSADWFKHILRFPPDSPIIAEADAPTFKFNLAYKEADASGAWWHYTLTAPSRTHVLTLPYQPEVKEYTLPEVAELMARGRCYLVDTTFPTNQE